MAYLLKRQLADHRSLFPTDAYTIFQELFQWP